MPTPPRAGLLLAPALIVILTVAGYPVLQVALYSFYDIDYAAATHTFIGLDNYRHLWQNFFFRTAIRNTVTFALVASLAEVALGLALALLLNRRFRGRGIVLAIVIFPMMLSTLVASSIWRAWFHYDFGMLNYWLRLLGLDPVRWLFDPDLALYAIVLVDLWQWTPMAFLIILAGLQGVPVEVLEAARIDGANRWQEFLGITLPMIRAHLALALLLRLVDSFKLFDKVYALTGGGPGNATETLSMLVYRQGFKFFDVGLASATSVVMLGVALLLSLGYALLVLNPGRR